MHTLTRRSLVLLPLLALGFTGCAGKMSKADCEKTDFYQVGLKDGKAGRGPERLAELNSMCVEHGVPAGDSKYTYGRQVGLTEYCSDSRAASDAKAGRTDSICAKEKVPPYQTAYARALEAEKANRAKELKKVENSKAELDKKAGKLQSELNQYNQQGSDANSN
jgi:hypothetical protein